MGNDKRHIFCSCNNEILIIEKEYKDNDGKDIYDIAIYYRELDNKMNLW